jgi:hypothetical protein
MGRTKSKFALLGAASALALALPFASPASGIINACSFGQFPNAPGGQSGLKAACTFGNLAVKPTQTIHDFPQAAWHNGAAWKVTDGVTTAASATVTAASGHFNAATDINHTISGLGIAPNSFIVTVNSPTSVTLNKAATATVAAHAVLIENSDIRAVADGVTTASSTTITSATMDFQASDIGRYVTGTNIPRGTTITSVTNATTADMSVAATTTGTAQTLTIGATESVSTTRQIADGNVTATSTTMTSATANFQASDAQLPVTGCGIPTGTYISSVTNSTTVVLSQAATLTRPFTVTDGVTTAASKTVTSGTAGFTLACDKAKGITSGAGEIPVGATIANVTSLTSITLSANATATATGVTLTVSPGSTVVIGVPTATAPINGDAASVVRSELNLNPTLVKGSDPCAAGTPEGTSISGGWYNPGSFQATLLSSVVPSGAIGQVLYPTAVVSFAAYVVPELAATAGDPQVAAHVDVIFPFLPTGLALCGSPALGIGSSFTFDGTTIGTQKVATGVGRPSTALRGIQDLGIGVSTFTGNAYQTNGVSTYTGACTMKFPATIDFLCGNG